MQFQAVLLLPLTLLAEPAQSGATLRNQANPWQPSVKVTLLAAPLRPALPAGPPRAENSGRTRGQQILAFMETVACSRLQTGACELLNAENARNILLTHRAVLSMRLCGSGNFNTARVALETEFAPSLAECRELLQIIDREGL